MALRLLNIWFSELQAKESFDHRKSAAYILADNLGPNQLIHPDDISSFHLPFSHFKHPKTLKPYLIVNCSVGFIFTSDTTVQHVQPLQSSR